MSIPARVRPTAGEADEVRPHGAAREDGFDVVHDRSFLRWGWSRGRLGRGTGNRRRGGFGRESEGFPLDRRDARLPPATEGRPSREALEEGETLALKGADGLPRLRALRSRERCRSDDAVLGDREDALQEPRRAPWAGVHREVEDGVVETSRQFVAASRIPEQAAVDRGGFGPCQRGDVGGGNRMAARPRQRRGGDPEIGGAARIGGVVHVSALVPEDVRERRLEAVRSHEMILCWGDVGECAEREPKPVAPALREGLQNPALRRMARPRRA